MAEAVYILCALTSLACAVLLLRAYRGNGNRLLLWSGLCFACLSLNNALLFFDLAVYPTLNLSLYRNISACAAISLMLFGLVWETE